MGMQRKTGTEIPTQAQQPCRGRTMQLWGSLCHIAWEAGKQDVAAMPSSLLKVWKNAGDTLREGKG